MPVKSIFTVFLVNFTLLLFNISVFLNRRDWNDGHLSDLKQKCTFNTKLVQTHILETLIVGFFAIVAFHLLPLKEAKARKWPGKNITLRRSRCSRKSHFCSCNVLWCHLYKVLRAQHFLSLLVKKFFYFFLLKDFHSISLNGRSVSDARDYTESQEYNINYWIHTVASLSNNLWYVSICYMFVRHFNEVTLGFFSFYHPKVRLMDGRTAAVRPWTDCFWHYLLSLTFFDWPWQRYQKYCLDLAEYSGLFPFLANISVGFGGLSFSNISSYNEVLNNISTISDPFMTSFHQVSKDIKPFLFSAPGKTSWPFSMNFIISIQILVCCHQTNRLFIMCKQWVTNGILTIVIFVFYQ